MKLDDLIYDRTIDDVSYALLNPGSKEHLKGCYNYVDLNRIEQHCKYIMDLRNKKKVFDLVDLVVKTNWKVTDIPHINDFNRIRSNIIVLMEGLRKDLFEDIEFSDTMDYIKANILEKDLYIIKGLTERIERELQKCGSFYCGSKGLYAKPKEFIKIDIFSGDIRCGEEFKL